MFCNVFLPPAFIAEEARCFPPDKGGKEERGERPREIFCRMMLAVVALHKQEGGGGGGGGVGVRVKARFFERDEGWVGVRAFYALCCQRTFRKEREEESFRKKPSKTRPE